MSPSYDDILSRLSVVLVRSKFPENVGSAARACANFGCRSLHLVTPQSYDPAKAEPLATVHAKHLLDGAGMHPSLEAAVADAHAVYGTTARTGGWRRHVLSAPQAGAEIAAHLAGGRRVALVFGSEDKGLENAETSLCTGLVNIATAPELTSLNLAQAVLLLLYECHNHVRSVVHSGVRQGESERFITHAERQTLLAALQRALLAIGYLQADNPDYWMLPVKRFLDRQNLKRHEFNHLMGVCRQVEWMAGRGEE